MHIKPFQAIFPNLELIPSPDSFFETVKEEYPDHVKSGFFYKASRKAAYIYKIQRPERHHIGLIANVAIEDFQNGYVKKHEHTILSKEQKQIELLLKRHAAVKPVLLTYPEVDEITRWLETYSQRTAPFLTIDFETEQSRHLIWTINDLQDIRFIQTLFEQQVPRAYIADGHHRSAAASWLFLHHQSGKKYNQILSAFFSSREIDILDFNRLVNDLNEHSMTRFMAQLSQLFHLEVLQAPEKPGRKHELIMCLNDEWYRLTLKPEILKKYRQKAILLDAALLHERILRDLLEIEDVRSDPRIDYIEGPKGMESIYRKTLREGNHIGFFLYPVDIQDLMFLADQDEVLPPKSTWFEPRMKNGIIVFDY